MTLDQAVGKTMENARERSSIAFPEPIAYEKAEAMLHYVANMLPADIHCCPSPYVTLGPRMQKDEYLSALSGDIKDTKTLAFDTFSCNVEDGFVCALVFQHIPGYTVQEHSEKVVKLWDDVRDNIAEYFRNT
jgi:hypothetical protein